MSLFSKLSKDSWMLVFLLILNLVPSLAGSIRLFNLLSGSELPLADQRFAEAPVPVILHILSAVFYGLLSMFQFSSNFRKNHITIHRRLGRFLLLCGLMAAATGIWMAFFYPKVPTDGPSLFYIRLFVGLWMLLCLLYAYREIRKLNVKEHRMWMVRAYAVGLGAGTQVFTHLPWFVFVGGDPSGWIRDGLMAAGWIINIVFAEVYLRNT